jgi:hypothetical protein
VAKKYFLGKSMAKNTFEKKCKRSGRGKKHFLRKSANVVGMAKKYFLKKSANVVGMAKKYFLKKSMAKIYLLRATTFSFIPLGISTNKQIYLFSSNIYNM